jgi:outer membrane protein OmpA-like peptidoglycan-associated protein
MKKNLLFFAGALLTSQPLWAAVAADPPDAFTVQVGELRKRAQLASDPNKPLSVYLTAKAQAWLDYALDEHLDLDDAPVAEHALGQAKQLVVALETNAPEPVMIGNAPDSVMIRPDLWQKLTEYKQSVGAPCAAPYLGPLEVELIWAGHELNELGPRHARPYVDESERIAAEAQREIERCEPNVAQKQPPPLATEVAKVPEEPHAPEEPVEVAVARALAKLPSEVHFAGFSDEISPATGQVLTQVADVMRTYPWLKIELDGHTSGHIGQEYNMDLSRRRVKNVKALLIELGLTEDRFTSQAFGMNKHKFNSRTPNAMAHNRRVEFIIINGQDPARNTEISTVPQEGDLQYGNVPIGSKSTKKDQQ